MRRGWPLLVLGLFLLSTGCDVAGGLAWTLARVTLAAVAAAAEEQPQAYAAGPGQATPTDLQAAPVDPPTDLQAAPVDPPAALAGPGTEPAAPDPQAAGSTSPPPDPSDPFARRRGFLSAREVAPRTGSPGSAITISGANFGYDQGQQVVTLNRDPEGVVATCKVQHWSADTIEATVPEVPPGVYSVMVYRDSSYRIAAAWPNSEARQFEVPPPAETSDTGWKDEYARMGFLSADQLAPHAGAAETVITIEGSNFGKVQGRQLVTLNHYPEGVYATCEVRQWSDNRIVAVVPHVPAGGYFVAVYRDDTYRVFAAWPSDEAQQFEVR